MGHFFHAVGVFFHHLAAVDWKFLAYAVACHIVKLLFRAVAWRSIINAAYPDGNLKLRSAFGAYVAGVGVNSVVPARGGDIVKLYLVKQRIRGNPSYATLTPTLIVETLFDFVVAGAIIVWAMTSGVLPTHQIYSRIPTVDWKFFLRHEHFTGILLGVMALAAVRARRHPSPGDLVGVSPRLAVLLPGGVRRARDDPQRAARAGGRLAR